jgi:hypothetical protein
MNGLGQLNNGVTLTKMGLGAISPALGLGALEPYPEPPAGLRILAWALSIAGMGLGAYHGYHRNRRSTGWAVWWGLMGGLFPIITTVVSMVQGYGAPYRRR